MFFGVWVQNKDNQIGASILNTPVRLLLVRIPDSQWWVTGVMFLTEWDPCYPALPACYHRLQHSYLSKMIDFISMQGFFKDKIGWTEFENDSCQDSHKANTLKKNIPAMET